MANPTYVEQLDSKSDLHRAGGQHSDRSGAV